MGQEANFECEAILRPVYEELNKEYKKSLQDNQLPPKRLLVTDNVPEHPPSTRFGRRIVVEVQFYNNEVIIP